MKGTPEPWVLVAGGFHLKGGMDRANAALATFLASRGHRVHLVAHEVAPALAAMEGVTTHIVARPGGSYFLGDRRFIGGDGWSRARCKRNRPTRGWSSTAAIAHGRISTGFITFITHGGLRARAGERGSNSGPRSKVRWPADRNCDRCRRHGLSSQIRNGRAVTLSIIWGFPRRACTPFTLARIQSGRRLRRGCAAQARERLGCGGEGRSLHLSVDSDAMTAKGFDTMLAAWIRLCADPQWDVDLLVAGGGREVESWKDRVERAGLAHRVRMLGFTERVDEVLAAADVLVSPVRYEAYGLNVHEAICCGVPAIVSACAGVAERYPAQLSGLLLRDPDDVGELVERMRGWRESIDAWKESVKPLAAELRSRSWEAMANEFVTLVQNSADHD